MVGGHATVGWLSNNVLRRFKHLGNFLKKVTERSRAVVGGHATVGRLSNNVFKTFQAIRNNFEKSHWTVTRQWSEVTRPSADCQTTFLDVSSNLKIFLKKVTEGHATVVGGHATVGWLSNIVFLTFQAIRKNFEKSHWRTRDSGRRSRDRWMTVKQGFWTFQAIRKIFEKVTEGHATVVGGHATVVWLSNKVFWTFQAIRKFFEKVTEGHATVVGGHATVGWLSKNVFRRFKQFGNFWKKSLKVTATVVGGHATVVWLSNNVFLTFQTIRKKFEKSHWRSRDSGRRSRDRCMTVKQRFLDVSSNSEKFWKKSLKVTRQWSEVTRPLDDCQTTFFRRFKQFGKILKKSLNGHATKVGGHATVVWLSNNVFKTFQAIWNFFEKSHWTVTLQWSEVTRPSAACQTTFFVRFKQFEFFLKKVT